MPLIISQAFNLNICLAGGAAAYRFRSLREEFSPFVLLIWLSCLNELLSFELMEHGFQTTINNNLYVLVESLLIVDFYRRTKLVLQKNLVFFGLAISFCVFWLIENLIVGSLWELSSYFRIYYSFAVVLLSIDLVNALAFTEETPLLRNPSFLIGVAFIAFFTFKVLVEAFWIYRAVSSVAFLRALYNILVLLNLFVNLVFFVVVLWIPKKQESILQR